MEKYLQEISKLMALRLKERTLSVLRKTVEESAQEKIQSSKAQVVEELNKQGITNQEAVNTALKNISKSVVEEFMGTQGSILMPKVPEIIQGEALKLGEELAQAVKQATSQAAAQVAQELSGHKE